MRQKVGWGFSRCPLPAGLWTWSGLVILGRCPGRGPIVVAFTPVRGKRSACQEGHKLRRETGQHVNHQQTRTQMSAVTTSRLQFELSSLFTWKCVTSYTKHSNLSDPYSRLRQRLTFVWKVLKRHNANPTVNDLGAWIFFSAAQINCWAVRWASAKAAVTQTRGNEMHAVDSGAISPIPNTTIGLLSHSCQVSPSVKCKCDAYLPYNPFRVVIILLTLLVQDTNHVGSQYSATKVILSDRQQRTKRKWRKRTG